MHVRVRIKGKNISFWKNFGEKVAALYFQFIDISKHF